MPSATTISGAGAHASAAAADRIPASKAGVKGYLTPSLIKDYILGLANTFAANLTVNPGNIFLQGYLGWFSGSIINGSSDGVIRLSDSSQTDFGRLQLGGTTSAYPALKRSTTYISMPLGDDTLPGLVDAEVFATTQVVTSLTNNSTSAQNVFASANDVLTLRAATTYFFECLYYINTGATTHTTATGFVASSAFTNIAYWAELWSTTAGTISTTAPSVLDVTASTATVLNATSTATRTQIRCRGMIRTNASTTITPQITFSAGPTGTCEVAVNSFFRAWPVGVNTIASFGDWA